MPMPYTSLICFFSFLFLDRMCLAICWDAAVTRWLMSIQIHKRLQIYQYQIQTPNIASLFINPGVIFETRNRAFDFHQQKQLKIWKLKLLKDMLLQLLTSAKHQSLSPNFLLHISFSSLSKINLNLMPCLGIKLKWGLPSTHEACNRASALRETGIYIVYLEEKQEVYYIWVNTGFCFNNRGLAILH